MTKKELESRLRQRTQEVRLLEDVVERMKPSGPLDSQVEDIERQIEVAETEASMDIATRIEHCVEKTGRAFTFTDQTGQRMKSKKRKKAGALRQMVIDTAHLAASKDFDKPCDFRKWAEPIFMEVWNNIRHFSKKEPK